MARRGVWTGSISFGLVSVGVKALTAVRDHDVHFHQIERGTGARIGNQKVSKETGEPVDKDDIEMGYEVSKGRYVAFDPKEIDELRPRSTRTIDVTDFVDLASIDPVFYERTYWLAPTDDGAERAYRLLAAAMEDSQMVGIGTVVMRNKQYLAAIRPIEGALAMSTMRFADEVTPITEVDEIPTGGRRPAKKELALAEQVIEALATDWDPDRYSDTFTEELTDLIVAKERGDEVVTEADEGGEDEGAKVIDLMAALEASVEEARSGGRSRRSRSTGSGSTRSSRTSTSKKGSTKRSSAEESGSTKAGSKKAGSTKTGSRKAGSRKASSKTTTSSSTSTKRSKKSA
jgi:DNA end-binding protein Ku